MALVLPKSAPLTELEIKNDKSLLRYHNTMIQTLNNIHQQSLEVDIGVSMKGRSTASQVLEGTGAAASMLPVFSEIAQLVISIARYAVDRHDDHKDHEVAEKVLALNPTHDTLEWNKFTRQLATKLTSENQEDIRNCGKNLKNNDEIGKNTQSILGRSKLSDKSLNIKDMAVRDCSRILTTILSKDSPSPEEDRFGVEDEVMREELINEFVKSARTPPQTAKAKEGKSIFTFSHALGH